MVKYTNSSFDYRVQFHMLSLWYKTWFLTHNIYIFILIALKFGSYFNTFLMCIFVCIILFLLKFRLCHGFTIPMGYRNASLHNTFMVNLCHLLSPWFTSLLFDLCEMYPSHYHQMTVLARYSFKHKITINNVITLIFHFFKKITHQSHVTNLNYPSSYDHTNLIFICMHCIK